MQGGVEHDELWREVFDRVMAHPAAQRVVDHVFQRVDHTVSRVLDEQLRRLEATPRARPRRPPNQGPRGAAPPPPPPPPSPPPASNPEHDARVVLGFAPSAPLSAAAVKARRRELAALFHPDRQGSTEAMRRVNAAADMLLANLQR